MTNKYDGIDGIEAKIRAEADEIMCWGPEAHDNAELARLRRIVAAAVAADATLPNVITAEQAALREALRDAGLLP